MAFNTYFRKMLPEKGTTLSSSLETFDETRVMNLVTPYGFYMLDTFKSSLLNTLNADYIYWPSLLVSRSPIFIYTRISHFCSKASSFHANDNFETSAWRFSRFSVLHTSCIF